MNEKQRHIVLLGPQPNFVTLKSTLARMKLKKPVALITAGWETDEQEDAEVQEAIAAEKGQCVNLRLFARTEQLFADDPELIQTLQARQDELRHLRNAYNDRLHHLLKAARQMFSMSPQAF